MILPSGTTVAVADGETVRLFHNTGVKRGVHLVEITAAPVVSDPRTLGEMRKHFHRDLRGKIIGEFAKDFSRRPLEDIASLIADT
jgi:protein required for attachment to host cells